MQDIFRAHSISSATAYLPFASKIRNMTKTNMNGLEKCKI